MNSTLIQEKYCARCETRKPLTEWYRNSGSKGGYSSICKKCERAKRLETGGTKRPKEKLCPACKTVKPISDFHGNRMSVDGAASCCIDCGIWRHAFKRYRITKEQYVAMFLKQDGKCAICGKPSVDRLFIDHDHNTNKVRGLVHANCNKGIGLLGDSPEICQAAAEYLRRTKDKSDE